MKRRDCWMTFSEALEEYLKRRAEAKHFGPGRNRDAALESMREAARQMDALVDWPDPNEDRK